MDVFKAIKVGDDFCTRLIDILVNQLTPKFKELEQLQLLSTPNAQVVLEAKRKEIVPLIKTTTRLEKGLDRVLIIVVKAINQVNQDLQEEEYGSIHNDDTTIGICKSLLIKALSKRGELEQAFERRHYQDCLATIQRVVSKWPTPGILTLQAELRELEFAVDTDQLVETDGFTLPPGYSLASDWMVRHGRREPPRSIIRWLTCDTKGKNISRLLIFNNINPHYHAFLEQCKKDSLALAKALQAEFRKRNVPIWCKGGRETGKYDSIRFLIRPLFTKSELNDKEKAGTRQDWKTEEQDLYLIHVDVKGRVQAVRYWTPQGIRNLTRVHTAGCIGDKKNELSKSYGRWDIWSTIIAEEVIETLRYIEEYCSKVKKENPYHTRQRINR